MSEWKQRLQGANEEYLTGLTNKGIVKRACKDLEQAALSLTEEENCLTVQVEDATCTLVYPLGESKCSCPSRSICKHIVMAVLYARDLYNSGKDGNGEKEEENGEKTEEENGEKTEEGNGEKIREEKGEENGDKAGEENRQKTGEEKGKENSKELRKTEEEGALKERQAGGIKESGQKAGEMAENVRQQEAFPTILGYPLVKLKKAIGEKRFQSLYYALNQGMKPDIRVSSIITVHFPDTDITVRLLEPVEYSSCSCHKKEFCQHKAEAVLSYQLYAGKLTVEELLPEWEEKNPLQWEEVREFARLLKDFLGEQLVTGLARSSQTVMDSLERLAIIGHNRELPDFERDLRELSAEYQLYFKRTASFQVKLLLHRLCSLYRKAEALEKAQTNEEVRELAGEFRTGYFPCPPLKLSGMGQREFVSKSGYEGETFYFLNEDTLEWYTYTNARPVFYEKEKRRAPVDQGKAPWELPCKLEELAEAGILLQNGKASREHRLSSSAEARAEYLGRRRLVREKLKGQYFESFKQVFDERLADSWQQEGEAENNLVLLQPAYIKNPSFDSIKQQYSMELYDKEEQKILLEVSYSKTEHYTIRYLERLAKRIGQGDAEVPCFFGFLYVKEGIMRLYPINYYDDLE
ncbi:SWIM zinc finger [Anaerocolumna jejuensis DSM 15929]|uniref:SWIM zinc finger n=1 Tax=Anaerocolumna jejuensis DSM 15929 TaxID=1121322 RepID=A0A1M6NM55_9FIRM|nr:SWIM zinc finger family protein [Anaerocolumna jejuensis]SHJ96716.1 SWIM zinc finger [Anaerocolumna jejuensis DSM 15929]